MKAQTIRMPESIWEAASIAGIKRRTTLSGVVVLALRQFLDMPESSGNAIK